MGENWQQRIRALYFSRSNVNIPSLQVLCYSSIPRSRQKGILSLPRTCRATVVFETENKCGERQARAKRQHKVTDAVICQRKFLEVVSLCLCPLAAEDESRRSALLTNDCSSSSRRVSRCFGPVFGKLVLNLPRTHRLLLCFKFLIFRFLQNRFLVNVTFTIVSINIILLIWN